MIVSTGHRHDPGPGGHSMQLVQRLIDDPEVKRHFYKDYTINRDYDLPYLGGYSKDGGTIYIDRHLPDKLTIQADGLIREFNPIPFIVAHERFEKAVMDALGWHYLHAHQAATAYERRQVMASGL